MTSETGGQKGQKESQLSGIDSMALMYLGEVAGFGARKYELQNFLKGYDWNLSYDAMMRHMLAFWAGEDKDECPLDCDAERDKENRCTSHSGLLHVTHAAWHALALTSFMLRDLGTDNRFVQRQAEEEPSFKVGDRVKIVAQKFGHCFEMGEIVRLREREGQDDNQTPWIAEHLDRSDYWWVNEHEFEAA